MLPSHLWTTHRSRTRRGFTLVELLVVVSIIALLIAIMLPSLRRSRDTAKTTVCKAHLRDLGFGMRLYANDNLQWLPDYNTMGRHGFRIAPGRKLTPSSPEESWGLQNVLEAGEGPQVLPNGLAYPVPRNEPVYIDGSSKAWVCPSNEGPRGYESHWAKWGNTYAYRQNSNTETYNLDWLCRQIAGSRATGGTMSPILWDNFQKLPGESGFIGPFKQGYSVDDKDERPPHRHGGISTKGVSGFWIGLYADNHVEFNAINKR